MLQYKYMTGGKVQCRLCVCYTRVRSLPDDAFRIILLHLDTNEEMQPNPEVSRKIVNWIEKLGLDQVLKNKKK